MPDRPAVPRPGLDAALFDANEYLIAGLENQAEWWEHLGDAHRDYAALARVAVAQEAELSRLREERDLVQRWLEREKEIAQAAEARCARLQQAILTSYVCEECGRLGLITEFGDDCKPGWTHGRLVKVKSVGEALAGPDTPADSQPEETTT